MFVYCLSRIILMCRRCEHITIFISSRSRADTYRKRTKSQRPSVYFMQICAKEKTNSFPTDHATFAIMGYDNLFPVRWSVSIVELLVIHIIKCKRVLIHEKCKEGSKRCKYGNKLTFERPSWWRLLKNY
jgi:hypothetical protein